MEAAFSLSYVDKFILSKNRMNSLLTVCVHSIHIGQHPDINAYWWSGTRKATVSEDVKLDPSLVFKIQFPMKIIS